MKFPILQSRDMKAVTTLFIGIPKAYIGFGAGAHSFFENNRFNNIYDLDTYIEGMKKDKLVSENFEFIR